MLLKYVIVTPARNEEAYIEETIRSVIAQTELPYKWIIVSDGSTDRTDEIIKVYTERYSWITMERMPDHRDRQFAAKANCFNAGYARLRGTEFDIIGNLDADITFEADYFAFLLKQFESIPNLGVAGTPFVENFRQQSDHTYAHRFARLQHVSGACQLFRTQCFEEIGGYQPIEGGAIDWIAVTTARMHGWRTQTFTEKVCFHHRKLGTGNNRAIFVFFHYGKKAYYTGGHPLWELLRGCFQMRNRPYVIGGLLFQFGFIWSWMTRIHRPISQELMAFHRSEQMARLKALFHRKPKKA